MIFITVGSQKFSFDRLLKEVDDLIEKGNIKEEVFGQTGHSSYVPQYYDAKPFLDREEFRRKLEMADVILTHGGTGVIVQGIKRRKKVIVVPRQKGYGEHVDDHQMQITKEFAAMNLIEPVYHIEELGEALGKVREREYRTYESSTQLIIESIENDIESLEGGKR